MTTEPKGIGGWLFVLWLQLGVGRPLIAIAMMTSGYGTVHVPGVAMPGGVKLAAGSILLGLGVATNVAMLRRQYSGLVLAYVSLVAWPVWQYMYGLLSKTNNAATLSRSLFVMGLWTVYLLSSKRVENTFLAPGGLSAPSAEDC